tara:strand:+ start:1040 stop:1333 length:294 start_codon:yes stop_codon:yes gene_type:complete
MSEKKETVAEAIRRSFISPNVIDSNYEAANLVDTTQKIAVALFEIAEQMEKNRESHERIHDRFWADRLKTDQKYYGDNISEVVDLQKHNNESNKEDQ